MFSCSSSSQSYSLVHCSVLSVSVTASVLYLIPSSSYSLSLFICFPPSLSFITLMKKRGENALKIFRGGSRVLAEAMQRDEEGWRARREGDSERQKIWSDVPLQCQQTRSSPCVKKKRGLRATQNKGVMVKAALESSSFVACQSWMQALCTCGIQARVEETQGELIKPLCIVRWPTFWHWTWRRNTERVAASEWD